ncbi:lipid droplet-associated hydrolase isoform X1 [Dipodomys merriami]|uniref:lipid droplet-associated hydrolase isoform X1 n=1 Tax=Dipodomys merriami TaxID=94247 RepID=UPI003855DD88
MDSETKEEVPLLEEFVLCGGIETQVLKCGPWTDLFNEQSINRPKLLIVIIPGNPGFPFFYISFAKALYSLTGRCFPVWIISHAGHVLAPANKTTRSPSEDPSAQEIKDVYGLNGQTEHKLAFLKTHVPKEMKLMLIGHSVGCYLALQILKQAPELPVFHTFLLFPTIERLSESPNGRIATPILCWLRYIFYVPGYFVLKLCPEIIKSLVIKMSLHLMNMKRECLPQEILQPFCFANAAYLGAQEMMQVVKRDDETIRQNLSKLTFYYGTVDGWCPVKYYEDIKKDFPEGDIRLCEKNIPHAFILNFSQEIAVIVADWLKDNLSKI